MSNALIRSEIYRKLMLFSSKCVAKLCLKVCGVLFFSDKRALLSKVRALTNLKLELLEARNGTSGKSFLLTHLEKAQKPR